MADSYASSFCQMSARDVSLEAPHSPDPAIIIVGLAAQMLCYLLLSQSRDDGLGDRLGFNRASHQEGSASASRAEQHIRAHPWRTQARDFDPGIAVRDGQPFGQSH